MHLLSLVVRATRRSAEVLLYRTCGKGEIWTSSPPSAMGAWTRATPVNLPAACY
jgi:hypothetical protein